jgi:hypothetical protein
MGEGAAVNRHSSALALLFILTLSACGTDKSENILLDAVTAKAKASLAPKQAGTVQAQAPSRAQLETLGAPIAIISVPSAGAVSLMGQLSANNGTQAFASPDGSMVTYRGGVLISTRGITGGLMSASVPSPAALAQPGSSHQRTHYVLGDNDSIAPIPFTCTTAFVGTETVEVLQKRHNVRHMTETCTGAPGQITNHYWFEGGSKIRASRQWVTPTLGYFETQHVID